VERIFQGRLMQAPHIAISGAGIAGLTAALALAQKGFAVTLIEKRTGFTETGAGIQLSPNAVRGLETLGLGSAIRRAGFEPEEVAIHSATGREIGAVALRPFMQENYEAPYLTLLRADLHTLLLDAVRGTPSLRLIVGRNVSHWQEEREQINLTLTTEKGGAETLEAAALIGADGLHSKTREQMGDKRSPVFAKAIAWRALVPLVDAPDFAKDGRVHLWLGRQGHVVHYPVGQGRLLNIVAVLPAQEAVPGWSQPGERDEMIAAWAKAAQPLREIVSLPAEWLCWSLYDLPVHRLAQGRCALIGDAGHPILPFLAQGAALAIEDGLCLARICGENPTDIASALRLYTKIRLPRVRQAHTIARRNGMLYRATGLKALLRNLRMAHLGPEGMARRYDWVYGHRD
jgi:salicylate hydroxylase